MKRHRLFLFSILLPFFAFSQALPDNCTEKFFIKTYGIADRQFYNFGLTVLKDNSTITCGYLPNSGSLDNSDAFLLKTKSDGTKEWEKVFGNTGSQAVHKLTTLADGNIIFAGSDRRGAELTLFLSKIDPDGNILWKKHFLFPHSQGFTISDIKEDTDGSIYLLAYYLEGNLSFRDNILFVRFNASGNLQYSRTYIPPVGIRVLFGHSLIIRDGYSYIAGHHYDYDKYKGLLLKINNTSATHQWTKVYDFNGKDAIFYKVLPYGDDGLCILGADDINLTDTSVVMVTDFSGNVISSKFFHQEGGRNLGHAVIDNNQNLTWINYYYRYGAANNTNLNITRLHPMKGVTSSKNYNQLREFPRTVNLSYGSDSVLFFSGNHTGETGMMQMYLGKISKEGDLGCVPEIVNTEYGDAKMAAKEVIFSLYDVRLDPVVRDWEIFENKIDREDYLCNLLNVCTSLTLSANTKICSVSDTIFVTATKDLSCFSSPVYAYDETQFRLVGQKENSTKFIALKEGTGTITARLNNGCSLIEDKVIINVQFAPAAIDLGKDTSLCKNNTIVLNARKGFVSYLWQDGTTDSLLQVRNAGIYSVEALNTCGQKFTDIIEVKQAPPVSLELGANLSKCNGDTISLTAPGGFINYNWTPKTAIKNDNQQTVKFFPQQTTQYKLVAEKTPGCFAEDSIVVLVNHSSPVALGADARFCNGDSLSLNAGAAFTGYLWNNGALTPGITVKNKGSYSVKAIDGNGCISYDTLRVLDVYPNPVVTLNKDAVLCKGDTKTLDAGSGYLKYLWNTGSTAQKIAVNQTGSYSVKVEDINGCTGHDSTTILKLADPPSGFLPRDTSLCTYAKLNLTVPGFSSYLWNTNSVVSSVVIDKAATYWLRVRDANGCTGIDSIIIKPEQCMEGFYIPTAFTPNGDGKNDLYRPLIFGNINFYRFTIYDRWGGKVFESAEPGQGWNGKIKGMEDKSSVFVWTCEYELQTAGKQFKKGSVTLIR